LATPQFNPLTNAAKDDWVIHHKQRLIAKHRAH